MSPGVFPTTPPNSEPGNETRMAYPFVRDRLTKGLCVRVGEPQPAAGPLHSQNRLLITLLLCAGGVLREPILYLSLYFKQHRPAYYDLLDRVRTKGDWETWLEFFLTGVRDTAEQAATAARRILAVFEDHRRKIEALGRPAASVLRVF